jgi:hypothetical protein
MELTSGQTRVPESSPNIRNSPPNHGMKRCYASGILRLGAQAEVVEVQVGSVSVSVRYFTSPA